MLAREAGVPDRPDDGVTSKLSDPSLLFFTAGFLIAFGVFFFSDLVPTFGAARFFAATVAGATFGSVKVSTDSFNPLSSCLSFAMYFGGSVCSTMGVAKLVASLESAIGTGVCGTEFPGVTVGSALTCRGGGDAASNLASCATGSRFGDKCWVGSVRSAEGTCLASNPFSVGRTSSILSDLGGKPIVVVGIGLRSAGSRTCCSASISGCDCMGASRGGGLNLPGTQDWRR